MKNTILITLIFANALSFAIAQKPKSISDTLSVRGNCEQCKERIEGAALKVKGVSKAVWSQETEVMNFEYDTSETSKKLVEEAIAKVGHDTGRLHAKDATYSSLPECCKYTRKNSSLASNGIQTIRYRITGMSCAEGCAAGIRGALYKLKGVKSSTVDFNSGIATIIFDSKKVSQNELKSAIENFHPDGENNKSYKAVEIE